MIQYGKTKKKNVEREGCRKIEFEKRKRKKKKTEKKETNSTEIFGERIQCIERAKK